MQKGLRTGSPFNSYLTNILHTFTNILYLHDVKCVPFHIDLVRYKIYKNHIYAYKYVILNYIAIYPLSQKC